MVKFETIDDIIKKRIVGNANTVDVIIEGCIGRGYDGFPLFQKFRENGYDGPYIGVNLSKKPALSMDLHYFGEADCLDYNLINSILKKHKLEFPVFVTNDCESILFDTRKKIDKALDVTCQKIGYPLQLHRQPRGFTKELRDYFMETAKEKYGFEAAETPEDIILIEKKIKNPIKRG